MNDLSFKRFGVMLDMSRNSVMNLTSLKRFAAELADLKYNTLLLYTEDTYEIPEEPYFGYMRGRYSQKEIRELVDFCEGLGMEVIPCIQTLAHLEGLFRHPRFQKIQDCTNILLADEEETYVLIEKMFQSVKSCYRSKIVHIGMDEAHMVGLGKHLSRFGFQNRFEILSRHLTRVCQLAEKYDLKPVMWSDMYFRLLNNGRYYNAENPIVPSPEEAGIPESVALTYWDYYYTNTDHYRTMFDAHRKLEREIWFAGGAWTWKGFAPDNRFSVRATKAALQACEEEGVENVFLTMWGDNGGECSRFGVLPALFASSYFARGIFDMTLIKQEFEAKYGISYDDFILLDLTEEREGEYAGEAVVCPEKYLLFNDPFIGLCDSTLQGGEGESYRNFAEKLAPLCNHPSFKTLFGSQKALAEVLTLKAELGIRTRKAYTEKNKEEMKKIIADYRLCKEKLGEFIRSFRALWFEENKAFGFEVQEIRLGGLSERLSSCEARLQAWVETDSPIEELEEAVLDLEGKAEWNRKAIRYPLWDKAVSPNRLY